MGNISTFRQLRRLPSRVRTMNPYVRTLYSFNLVSLLGGTVYGLYYGIFLYRHTFSLSVLALDGLFGGFGTWTGYLLGVLIIRRFGYRTCIRLAFGLWALTALATALIAGHIAEWFIAIAVVKAVPGGLFAATNDTIMLREVNQSSRSSFFRIDLALEFIATIVLPPLVGALVHGRFGYPLAFGLAAGIYLVGLVLPCRLPKSTFALRLSDVLQTFRRPLYPQQAANRTLAAGFNQLNAFVLTILPFLLIRNELTLGILTSVTGLLAAGTALGVRKLRARRAVEIGFGAHTVRGLASVAFVCAWSAPLMMAWQLLCKLVTPLHDPVQQSMDIQTDSLILGRDLKRQALQINILNNTLLLIGSTAAYSLFFVITRSAGHQQLILQILVLAYAGWRLASLALSSYINHHARILPWGLVRNPDPMPLGRSLQRLGEPLARLRFRLDPR